MSLREKLDELLGCEHDDLRSAVSDVVNTFHADLISRRQKHLEVGIHLVHSTHRGIRQSKIKKRPL